MCTLFHFARTVCAPPPARGRQQVAPSAHARRCAANVARAACRAGRHANARYYLPAPQRVERVTVARAASRCHCRGWPYDRHRWQDRRRLAHDLLVRSGAHPDGADVAHHALLLHGRGHGTMVESAVLATPPLLPCTSWAWAAPRTRRSAPTPSVLALRVPTPPMLRLPGPSIWDFLRYFLALDSDLKTVEKAPTRPHAHTPATYSRPTLSPHTLAPLSHRPALTPPNPVTPLSHPAPHSHRCQGF